MVKVKKIAVIGGGITGLSLAYYLTQLKDAQNWDITLFEPSERLGGMVESYTTKDGFTLECGPNVVIFKQELEELVRQLGLKAIYPNKYRQQVYSDGALHDVPKSPLKLITTKLLTWRSVVKSILAIFRKPFNQTNPQQSIADFFSPFGQEVIWKLIDPAIQGIYGGDITKLKVKSIFPQLWESVLAGKSIFGHLRSSSKGKKIPRKMGTIQGGLESLCTALTGRIGTSVHNRKKITSITESQSGGFVITATPGGHQEETYEVDVVCVTTSAVAMSQFMNFDSSLQTVAANLNTIPLSVVHMEASPDSQLQKNSFGALWPSSANTAFKGVLQNSELFPHTAPFGRNLITSMVGGDFGQTASQEELLELCKRSLAPFSINPIRVLKVTRWPKAIPQYDDSHLTFLVELDRVRTKYKGFYFLGSEVGGVGVADRIAIAKKVSEEVTRHE